MKDPPFLKQVQFSFLIVGNNFEFEKKNVKKKLLTFMITNGIIKLIIYYILLINLFKDVNVDTS